MGTIESKTRPVSQKKKKLTHSWKLISRSQSSWCKSFWCS